MLRTQPVQLQIIFVRNAWAPAFHVMTPRDQSFNLLIQGPFAAAAGQVMPYRDFHVTNLFLKASDGRFFFETPEPIWPRCGKSHSLVLIQQGKECPVPDDVILFLLELPCPVPGA